MLLLSNEFQVAATLDIFGVWASASVYINLLKGESDETRALNHFKKYFGKDIRPFDAIVRGPNDWTTVVRLMHLQYCI